MSDSELTSTELRQRFASALKTDPDFSRLGDPNFRAWFGQLDLAARRRALLALVDVEWDELKSREPMHDPNEATLALRFARAAQAFEAAFYETGESPAEAWQKVLGDLLTLEDAHKHLGIDEGEALTLIKGQELLGLPTSTGGYLLPAFQFTEGGRVHRVIAEVLQLFYKDVQVSPYTIASWFVSPQPLLDGSTPMEKMGDKQNKTAILEAARRTAARLAS